MKRGRDFFQSSDEQSQSLPLRRVDQALVEAILDEAKRRGITLSDDRDLLATLASVESAEQIPHELYTAMAVVLSWVDSLDGRGAGEAGVPAAVNKNQTSS